MKTIEERAEEYAISQSDWITTFDKSLMKHYIAGATEQSVIDEDAFHAIMEGNVIKAIEKQRQIDIDKACEWLKEHASNYGYADSDLGDATYHYNVEELVRAFTIAMER